MTSVGTALTSHAGSLKRKAENPGGVHAKKTRTEEPDIEDHNSEEEPAAEEVAADTEEQPAAKEVAADIVRCCAVCPVLHSRNSLFVPVSVHVFLP